MINWKNMDTLNAYAKLQKLLGYEPDYVWTEAERRSFTAGYTHRKGQSFKPFIIKKARTLLIPWFVFGIFASVYFVKRGNIWGIAAIHSIWNFAQGNIFGVLVSGNDFGTTVFKSEINESMTLINGGAFGLEGGILVTIVMVVGTIVMLMTKQKDVAEEA